VTGIVQFLIYLDRSVFQGINSLAGKWFLFDWLARLGADDHIIPIVLVLLVLLVPLAARDRQERRDALSCVICAVLAVAFSMVMLYFLNTAFFRPRPFTSRSVTLLFYNNTDSAFPSNAATLSFALAFAVLFYRRGVGAVMLALAVFQGFGRVFVGIHYPLDIIGGALLGGAGAMLARAAEPAYRPLARVANAALDRLFASWTGAGPVRARGGGTR
jgi:undecaprenyl-diphosphatase